LKFPRFPRELLDFATLLPVEGSEFFLDRIDAVQRVGCRASLGVMCMDLFLL
jgi:hypothetical protein